MLIILDGPQHPSGKPTVYYGARGGASVDVAVYTAKSAMHSGNYGNWLPDANVRLTQLIASMFDAKGKVARTIDVQGAPPAYTREEIAEARAIAEKKLGCTRIFA